MKVLLKTIIFLLFINSSYARELNIKSEIKRINKLTDKQQIHLELIKLRKKNQAFINFLMQDNSYRPDDFYNANDLDLTLEKLPVRFSEIPRCIDIKNSLMADNKASWQNIGEQTLAIWNSIEKICSK